MNRDTFPAARVLVIGASGHIGQRWLLRHAPLASPPLQARGTARQAVPGTPLQALDVRDAAALRQALRGVDAVVHAVAGSRQAIALGTQQLCNAALPLGVRLVHLSTQSVYGPCEGVVHESMPLDGRLGWYGRAKCEAELQLSAFVDRGGQAVVLRPGCVWGPGSWLWVGRLAQWLRAGRLGELGAAGDGWSNLVHVDDVGLAISRALQLPLQPGQLPRFNLAGPDSPRWNEVFADLALALGICPVPQPRPGQLWCDSRLLSPPLKLLQRLCQRLGLPAQHLPEAMGAGLVGLWARQMRLDVQAATDTLGLRWTPYACALADSVRWLTGQSGATDQRAPRQDSQAARSRNSGLPTT